MDEVVPNECDATRVNEGLNPRKRKVYLRETPEHLSCLVIEASANMLMQKASCYER